MEERRYALFPAESEHDDLLRRKQRIARGALVGFTGHHVLPPMREEVYLWTEYLLLGIGKKVRLCGVLCLRVRDDYCRQIGLHLFSERVIVAI